MPEAGGAPNALTVSTEPGTGLRFISYAETTRSRPRRCGPSSSTFSGGGSRKTSATPTTHALQIVNTAGHPVYTLCSPPIPRPATGSWPTSTTLRQRARFRRCKPGHRLCVCAGKRTNWRAAAAGPGPVRVPRLVSLVATTTSRLGSLQRSSMTTLNWQTSPISIRMRSTQKLGQKSSPTAAAEADSRLRHSPPQRDRRARCCRLLAGPTSGDFDADTLVLSGIVATVPR